MVVECFIRVATGQANDAQLGKRCYGFELFKKAKNRQKRGQGWPIF